MVIKVAHTGKFLTIRKRILVIAIFATLVPSLLLGWISYYQTYNLLEAKAVHELEVGLERVRRGLDAWFDEAFNGLRVFSGSFVLIENLTSYLQQSTAANSGGDTGKRLTERQISEYLRLVQDQLPLYHRLLVLDKVGSAVAQFPSLEMSPGFGPDWSDQIELDRTLVSDKPGGSEMPMPQISLGVPIVSASAVDLALLVAEIPLSKLSGVLELSTDMESEILLVDDSGEIVLSSLAWKYPGARGTLVKRHPEFSTAAVPLIRYQNYRGVDVVSSSLQLPQLPWHLVIERSYQSVFAEVDRLRDIALLLTLLLLTGFALLAYMVSQSILLPLSRLTRAAVAVADGDLDVALESDSRDELGFTITIFNDMVRHLRASRDELEKISITDSLTGLYNRKHVMDILTLQFSRYRRSGERFSLLMVDVDHFKQINDRHGHLAGDAALRQIGLIFRSVLRSVDIAGRYGGEEFLIILEQAGVAQALETAERVRLTTEKSELAFEGERILITVSVGVATVTIGGQDTPASLIQRADRRLYIAKQRGRNQVVSSDFAADTKSAPLLLPVWKQDSLSAG